MTGRRLVEAACQPAETYQRAETERQCRTVYSLLDYCSCLATSDTHVGRRGVLTDCRLIAARPLAAARTSRLDSHVVLDI